MHRTSRAQVEAYRAHISEHISCSLLTSRSAMASWDPYMVVEDLKLEEADTDEATQVFVV